MFVIRDTYSFITQSYTSLISIFHGSDLPLISSVTFCHWKKCHPKAEEGTYVYETMTLRVQCLVCLHFNSLLSLMEENRDKKRKLNGYKSDNQDLQLEDIIFLINYL